MSEIVPTVDIAGWAGGDAVDPLAAAVDWFFGLPIDTKRRFVAPRPSINPGYTPPRSERLSYSLGIAGHIAASTGHSIGGAHTQSAAPQPRRSARPLDQRSLAVDDAPRRSARGGTMISTLLVVGSGLARP